MSRGKRSPSLSRDAIVEEAIRIIAEEGLSGLTMRAVAARLGVTPMAAYYYVADKDELMRLVSERVSSSSGPLRLDPGEDWEEVLRARLIKLWENSTRYPGLGTYLINQPDLGVTSDQLESGVRFFEEVGFSPKRARQAWSFAMTYIHGRISVDAHLAHQPQAPRMSGLRARDYVDFGVGAVIAGLRALLASGDDGQPVALDGAGSRAPRAARSGARKTR
jgi:TetR/AcrR family transcriptional regulator, tetracycline repressor protein